MRFGRLTQRSSQRTTNPSADSAHSSRARESRRSLGTNDSLHSNHRETDQREASDEHVSQQKTPLEPGVARGFEEAVHKQQRSMFRRGTGKKFTDSLYSVMERPAHIVPASWLRAPYETSRTAMLINFVAAPVTLPGALVFGTLDTFLGRSPRMYDPFTIRHDTFFTAGIAYSPNQSRDIRRALRAMSVLSTDSQLLQGFENRTFHAFSSALDDAMGGFQGFEVSTDQRRAIFDYLRVTSRMSFEQVNELHTMPREARPQFFDKLRWATDTYSPVIMQKLREGGILDRDYLPKNAGLLTQAFFEQKLGGVRYFRKRDDGTSALDGTINPEGRRLEPHEVLVYALFANESLPRYAPSSQHETESAPPSYDSVTQNRDK